MFPAALAVILLLPCASCGAESSTVPLSATLMPEEESGKIVTVLQGPMKLRAQSRYSIKKTTESGKTIYEIILNGHGDYDRFEDVNWTIESRVRETDGLLYPLYSICTIKDKKQNILSVYRKAFDYDQQAISFSIIDEKGREQEPQTFPIKGPTTDDTNMVYFLKKFIALNHDPEYQSFYLLSSEPKLYKVNIKALGEETLDLPGGKEKAIKFQLMADLGPLTELAAKIVAPTFIWYKKDDPSAWFQYQGLEIGRHSAHIISSLTESQRPTD